MLCDINPHFAKDFQGSQFGHCILRAAAETFYSGGHFCGKDLWTILLTLTFVSSIQGQSQGCALL